MINISYFKYTEKEIEYLKKRDKVLAKAIDNIGMVKRKVEPDVFASLISSIISQQISTRAAITVKSRLVELIGGITAENIFAASIESIQECGMSLRKSGYIKGIAEAAITKAVDFNNLHKLTDEEVMKELTSLKGVGEWTVEMLLIHSLQRPNVLSYKDLAIRRGMMRLYNLEELSKKEFEKYRDIYSPYCTVASIYIWEISKERFVKAPVKTF